MPHLFIETVVNTMMGKEVEPLEWKLLQWEARGVMSSSEELEKIVAEADRALLLARASVRTKSKSSERAL